MRYMLQDIGYILIKNCNENCIYRERNLGYYIIVYYYILVVNNFVMKRWLKWLTCFHHICAVDIVDNLCCHYSESQLQSGRQNLNQERGSNH